jgi:hypothetical protein
MSKTFYLYKEGKGCVHVEKKGESDVDAVTYFVSSGNELQNLELFL